MNKFTLIKFKINHFYVDFHCQKNYIIQNNFESMTLEATMVMLDNSSSAINGDYLPTRWQSQVDAASILLQAKIQNNAQSSVGLGVLGGKHVEILCTPTPDPNKASSYLWGVKLGGQLRFSQGLQIAALALKHRLNTSQKQRIICFIGSTLTQSVDQLKILGKKLKKNSISVDLVVFGDLSEQQKLKADKFIQAIQLQQNSNIVYVDPSYGYLSDVLISSKILNNQSAQNKQGGDGNQVVDQQLKRALEQSRLQAQRQKNRETKPQDQPINPNAVNQKQETGVMPARVEKTQQKQGQVKPAQKVPEIPPKIQITTVVENVFQDEDELSQQEMLRRAQLLSLQEQNMEQLDVKDKDKKKDKDIDPTQASEGTIKHSIQGQAKGVQMSQFFKSQKHQTKKQDEFMKEFEELQKQEEQKQGEKKYKTEKHQ